VKKWVRRNGTGALDESTVYLGDLIEHHRWATGGGGENVLLHVRDGIARVALLRRGPAHPDDAGPAVRYELGDHLGSAAITVDDTGTWTNREEYFPYGETSFGGFARKRYRFTGMEREESRLAYHGARYYAPWLARWASCDPLRTKSGSYSYCAAAPLNMVDPTGSVETDPLRIEVDPANGGTKPDELAEWEAQLGPREYWSEEIVVEAPAWYREQFEEGGRGYDLSLGVLFGPPRRTSELDKLGIGVLALNAAPFIAYALEGLGPLAPAAGGGAASGMTVGSLAFAGGGGDLVLAGGAVGISVAIAQVAIAAGGVVAMAAKAIELAPYGGPEGGGGHHIPAKAAFREDPNYDPDEALAISSEMLEKLHLHHPNITRAQQFLYGDFAKTGQKMGWDVLRRIETDALVAQGVSRAVARGTVDKMIAHLRARGVTNLRTPYQRP
jgi:RHS repeat-associated protein